MKYLTMFMTLAMTTSSFAGTIDEINFLLEEIEYSVNSTHHTNRDLIRTQKRLERVLTDLTGSVTPQPVPVPVPTPVPVLTLFCDSGNNTLINLATREDCSRALN
ncbi:MAG: hypothetical protein HON90_12250 [Halobacteriovoraceae bacterium]|jgi:hypothetical protein|nr:hypothetical protein [Halobacteriovoraceae bacterium]